MNRRKSNVCPFIFQISVDRLYNRKEVVEALEKYIEQPHFKEVYVDLVGFNFLTIFVIPCS